MRYFIHTILIAGLLAIHSGLAYAGQPTVTVSYSPSFDSVCSLFRGGTIKNEWEAELTSRQGEFESLWKTVGSKLIETTEEITGKAFPAEEFNVRLTLCNMPSQSIVGISVNMRYALKSFTQTPVSMRYKVDTLYHELLHEFLVKNPVKDSVLLKQYAAEPERTLNHLHLLALQRAVFLKLNETEALEEVIAIDSQLPGGYYKRAWEIVNATDTEYLKFVAEVSQ